MKFSVIIPAYNAAPTLELLLRSLTEQTFADYEVIVIDDASSDQTDALLAGAEVRHERLPVNAGPAAARNRGAELARGQWLVFTDADTEFTPDTLASIARVLASSDADALFGSYAGEPASGGFAARYKALWEYYTIDLPFERTGRRLHRAHTWVPRPGVVRRAAFAAVAGFDTRFRGADLEDLEFGYRLHEAGYRIYFSLDVHIEHHYPSSLTKSLRSFSRRCVLWMRMAVRRRRLDQGGEGSPRQAVAHIIGFGGVVLALVSPWCWPLAGVAAGAAVAYTWLNLPFVVLAARKQGWGFALLAYGTCWLYTVVLGCSAGWGLFTGLLGNK